MNKIFGKSKSVTEREEFIEVERNVRLHVTDAGEGRAIELIPGWILSVKVYECQNPCFDFAGEKR